MIPVSSSAWQGDDTADAQWQLLLRDAITDPEELCNRLAIPMADREEILAACALFPLKVPEPYLRRIQPGNARDPLLLQVLPRAEEMHTAPGFTSDPLDERHHNPLPGLVHKYRSRVLLVTTSLCAVHCRYCFRREFPYNENRNSRPSWQQALDYIREHPELNEVILSGGDPLSLPDRQLAWLTQAIGQIPHIKRLRIHTRLPIVLPQRICPPLLDWLSASPLQKIVVLHCNHPREIDSAVTTTARQLKEAGVHLLNQSVLLAGVNDNTRTLVELSEALFAAGILPYYLHQLDRIRGSHTFEVPEERALALHQELQAALPGFLVPTLAREEPGKPAKTRLA